MANYKASRTNYIVKKVVETVNNSTTMQDDDELFFTGASNKIYAGIIVLYIDSGATPDFKFQLTGPSGATAYIGTGTLSSNVPIAVIAIATSITSIQVAGVNQIIIPFSVIIGSTSGIVNLQWAQNTQDASDTKVNAGSYIQIFTEK